MESNAKRKRPLNQRQTLKTRSTRSLSGYLKVILIVLQTQIKSGYPISHTFQQALGLAMMQFLTAGRAGEITGLQWSNIEIKNRRMHKTYLYLRHVK